MHPLGDIQRVLLLADQGLSQSELSRRTGIPRTTIRRWVLNGRRSASEFRRQTGGCRRCGGTSPIFPHVEDHAYAYLLGLYLGDGWLTTHPKGVFRLNIALDRAYPVIIDECRAAMGLVMPRSRVSVLHRSDANLNEVGAYSTHWPCFFPQHGPGLKHRRAIHLEPWQLPILDRHPWRFLRGLIHSDGCRVINPAIHPGKTYWYPRYSFSNRSEDIRGLFCEYCDKVGVEWRQMNRWNISVARRKSVALMDRHIGPKR